MILNGDRPQPPVVIYWLLFFSICCGLGYPTLNRFDFRKSNPDAVEYFKLVSGNPSDALAPLRYRVLVPLVAKPFFWIARGRIGSWNPVAFGMLIANSLFTATAACLLLSIGRKYVLSHGTAFAATLLYLLNFTVSNRQLAGLVESGEACAMLALYWLLFEQRYFLLPLIGLLGAAAKESFVPMAALAVIGWAIYESRHGRWTRRGTIWSGGMVLIGLSTVVLVQWSIGGQVIWPWRFAASLREPGVSLPRGLMGCIADRYFWYVFGWLLPLGAVRIRRLPTAWVFASLAGATAALAMGAWNDAAGNAAPSIFNSLAPCLCLSVAHLLCGGWNLQIDGAIAPPPRDRGARR